MELKGAKGALAYLRGGYELARAKPSRVVERPPKLNHWRINRVQGEREKARRRGQVARGMLKFSITTGYELSRLTARRRGYAISVDRGGIQRPQSEEASIYHF